MRFRLGLAVGIAAVLIVPASASAAVEFGSSLASDANNSVIVCPNGCTVWNEVLPETRRAPGGTTAPTAGIVVSVTIKKNPTGVAWPSVHFRSVRSLPGAMASGGLLTSPDVVPAPSGGEETFPTRLPVAANEAIAIEATGLGSELHLNGAFDIDVTSRSPEPLPPDGTAATSAAPSVFERLIRARLEPDADADGFGDETQDACPALASTQGPCPAPPAVPAASKQRCKKKKGKKKAAPAKRKKCKKKVKERDK